MTRFVVPLRLALAGMFFVTVLPRANADTLTNFLGEEVTDSGLTLANNLMIDPSAQSLTGGSACTPVLGTPFPFDPGPISTDLTGCAATSSAEGPKEALFLSPVIIQQPQDAELLIVSPATSSEPPQQSFGVWLLAAVLSVLALMGGKRLVRAG
jgi:hypothetical protein